MNPLTPSSPTPDWRKNNAIALGLLALLVFVLHGSAVHAYWRWDDGTHLFNSTQYTPWSVFLNPEVTRAVSGNQFAPWNLFVYQVNSALFGMDPRAFYLHHLLSLAVAAFALYVLMRQWFAPWRAMLAPALLLMGAPAFHMAQQLMVGHYLDGLTFACLALWAQLRAVERRQWRWAWLAAGLYLLSTLCKEVYVPWIALALFMPLGAATAPMPWVRRWRYALPSLAVALSYAAVRVLVFSGAGGYQPSTLTGWHDVPGVLAAMALMLTHGLVGSGVLGLLATALCLVCVGVSLATLPPQACLKALAALGAAITVVVFPLLFVARPGLEWQLHARLLWVPWAALCVLWCLPWPPRLARWHALALLVFVVTAGQQAWVQRQHDRPIEAMFDAHYGFALQPPPGQVLLPTQFNTPGYVAAVTMSAHAARQRMEPGLAHAQPALLRQWPADAGERARIRVWQDSCLCIAPLDTLAPALQQAALQAQLGNQAFAAPLRQPLPYIANAWGGAIDSITTEGGVVHVRGWTPTLGAGKKLFLTGFSGVPPVTIDNVQRPDVASAHRRADMLDSGFHATLRFANPDAAQAAAASLCAVVAGQLPGQEHQFLMLPIEGGTRCKNALMPATTRQM
ncbi:glycosyltransferase family 39 protein [Acidovorax sp. A1169]|uniref:glycosyltransferase family 39 protein n=1 Tax=Acidovorax sp. A1169 TaxID=3059524 RepID=UPI0027379C7D|nr:glycosyltransferase family 39 protein [Acidovorax sp. A1169]MDP4076708.1 glycosyltransferase family 39 protein [Acidovorax sp. A1169]